MNEILFSPEKIKLAIGIQVPIEIGGSALLQGDPTGFVPANFLFPTGIVADGPNRVITHVSAPSPAFNEVVGTIRIPKNQPWRINGFIGTSGNPREAGVGVVDNFGRAYISNPHGTGPTFNAYNIVSKSIHVSDNNPCLLTDGFSMDSNGSVLTWGRYTNGFWGAIHQENISSDVVDFRFLYMLAYVNTRITQVETQIFDVITALTTSNIQFTFPPVKPVDVAIIDINHFGLTGKNIGNWQGKLTYRNLKPVFVPVSVAALYIKPKNGFCNSFAIEGSTVEFETNGGLGGIFTASTGTVLPDLKWLAPFSEGQANFVYTVGTVSAVCQLQVVRKLTVNGVDADGFYPDMIQGDEVQFTSSCPNATFTSDTHPSLITTSGHLIAPHDEQDDVFGEKIVVVRVEGCGQTYNFKVRIEPMFPTPKFCGPDPLNWTKHRPDFLANTLTMTGGTSQVKNRNRDGVILWDMKYDALLQDVPTDCTCANPDDVNTPHDSNCNVALSTADRLDRFYEQVKYTNYFSVVDLHTEIVYKYVRLTSFDDTHGLYRNEQARQVAMRWEGNLLFD